MVTCSNIFFGAREMTYNLKFSIAFSAVFGTPLFKLLSIVLSTDKSLMAVSSRSWASLSLLSPTNCYNSQPVPQIQRQQRTSFISMIALATENAIATGLVLIQPGSLLRSICVNRKATPTWSFVIAFRFETCN